MSEHPPSLSWRPKAEDKLLPGAGLLLSRGLLYLILFGVIALTCWAARTRLEIVAEAEGRLTVKGETIRLSVHEAGVVTGVHVKVGQTVRTGDVLLSLDDYRRAGEVEALTAEIKALDAEREHFRRQVEEARDAIEMARREIEPLQNSRAISNRQLQRFQHLAQTTSVISHFEVEQKQMECLELDISVVRLDKEIQHAIHRMAEVERQGEILWQRRVALAARRAAEEEAMRRLSIRAPGDGVIVDLAVRNPGLLITPEQSAVVMMPADRPLVAEIAIPNPSMRRLRPGQTARLRLHAYPYQDYGELDGILESIEPDADPSTGHYRAWLELGKTHLRGPLGRQPLRPGLTLTAFIIIEDRTLLQSLLSPFRKLLDSIAIQQ